MADLHLDVHGICVTLESDAQEFLKYATGSLSHFKLDSPSDSDLDASIEVAKTSDHSGPPSDIRQLGRRIWKGDTSVYYVWNDLSFHASENDYTIKIHASIAEAQKSRAGRLDPRYLLFNKRRIDRTLTNYLVAKRNAIDLPVLALLCGRRGNGLLHASCVEKKGHATLLVGLDGAGKSTLARYLVDSRDFSLMSDEFTLIHPDGVSLAYPEAHRISNSGLKLLSKSQNQSEGKAWGKHLIPLDHGRVTLEAQIERVIFLSIGSESSISRINPEIAISWLEIFDNFLGELPQYSYLAFLPFCQGLAFKNREALKHLFLNTEIYSLVQERGRIGTAVDLLEETG